MSLYTAFYINAHAAINAATPNLPATILFAPPVYFAGAGAVVVVAAGAGVETALVAAGAAGAGAWVVDDDADDEDCAVAVEELVEAGAAAARSTVGAHGAVTVVVQPQCAALYVTTVVLMADVGLGSADDATEDVW